MAEYLRKTVDEHTVLAIWEISESVMELESFISLREDEKNLYDSFVADSRKKQWLAYRILIRNLLKPNDYPVIYDHLGRPFLAGSTLHISVTHSDNLAAVIISEKTKVGIDIEKIRSRVCRVKERFLNQAEIETIAGESNYEQLTLAWSAKEALYKLYGRRDLDFRENIRLEIPRCTGQVFRAEIIFEQEKSSYEIHNELIDGFILVYVSDPLP